MQMRQLLHRWIVPLVAVALLAFVGGSVWQAALQPAAAQDTATEAIDAPGADVHRTISVTGAGQVSATPDTAIIHLGVQTDDETAAAALEANNLRMQAVISATVGAGIAEEQIQTTGLRLQPQYDRSEEGASGQVIGYQANNNLQIRVRDLSALGTLLDAVVTAGVNTIDSIQFEVSNRDELVNAAREAAMNNAIDKAQQLTALAGATLGDVLTINESGQVGPVVVREAAFEVESAGAVPVQPGTQTIDVSVLVTWFIE